MKTLPSTRTSVLRKFGFMFSVANPEDNGKRGDGAGEGFKREPGGDAG